MRAVIFEEAGEPLTVETVDRPEVDPDGAVLETVACGICRSDWHAWQGDWEWLGVVPTPGQIFGHEPVGRVVEVGDNVSSVTEGELVTNPFNLSDGTCPHCQAGRANICEKSVPMGFAPFQQGAFAEEYPVRNADQNLVAIPDGVDPVDVAGLGCRFATAFHGVAHRIDVEPGDSVAVHGCGGVGLSAVHVANALGANVIAVDVAAEKLDRAHELGAVHTVDASERDDVSRAVADLAPGTDGADVSIDALGIAETVHNSIGSLGRGGKHLQIGMTTTDEGGEVAVPIDRMVTEEIEFYGTYGMPPHEYDEIFRMMDGGSIDPGRIIGETCSLAEIPDVLARLGEYDTLGIPVCTEF